MNKTDAKKVLDVLEEDGRISNSDRREGLAAGTDDAGIVQHLQALGKISNEDVAKALSKIWHLPYADLIGKKIRSGVFELIPMELAKTYRMVPFEKFEGGANIGLVDPQNIRAVEALDFMGREKGLDYKIHVISEASFESSLRQYESLSSQVEEALESAKLGDGEAHEVEAVVEEEAEVEEVIKTAPVSKVVHVILKHAVEGNASDVHIEPMEEETRVRYRVDGALHTSIKLPSNIHAAVVSRIKILSNLKIDETRRPQDGRFRINISGREIDCRVSTLPLYKKEKVVMRILDPEGKTINLSALGFSGVNHEALKRSTKNPHGIILVTGPTGSGKSTTLYAMLNILNKEEDNIVTLEDPIEYYLQGTNQSQINVNVGLTFATGLRSILRQDPDIIMVGEVRDSETAELVIHAGLTGHLVLSTLHTNDAAGAIPRLMDMKIEPFLIASALNLVVAQRLVRMICEKCKETFPAPPDVRAQIVEELSRIEAKFLPKEVHLQGPMQLTRGKGCPRCNHSGYTGRIAIAESFEVTEAIREMIVLGKSSAEQMKEAQKDGMISLKQDGLMKVLAGLTTFEEIWHVTKQ